MPKIISCGIAPLRKNGDKIEILLCKPVNGGFYGMGFLKGQVEDDETHIETAKREFAEESGDLQVEILNEGTYFIQNNPKKKIYIWPAKVVDSDFNKVKIDNDGVVLEHDHENELIKFYPTTELPTIFRNQQKILSELLSYIDEHKNTF